MSQLTVTGSPAPRTARGPLVERMASWSACHRIMALGVRGVLMALAVAGDHTWYLPRWLGWLPASRPGHAGAAR